MSASRISKEEMKQKINDLFELLTELNRVFDSFNRKDTEFFFRARKDELALFSDILGQWALGLSELKAAYPFEGVESKRLVELVDYLDELKSQLQIAVSVLSQVTDAIIVNLEKDNIETNSIEADIAIVIKSGKKSHDVTFVDFLRKLKLHAEKVQQIIQADNFKGLTAETRSSQAFTQAEYKLKLSVKYSPVDRLKELPSEIMAELTTHLPADSMRALAVTSSHFSGMFDPRHKEHSHNLWRKKLLQLGVKPSVLDLYDRLFARWYLPLNYRELAGHLERILNCVEKGFFVLDWQDPQVQLETLLICSQQPLALELNVIQQNKKNTKRLCATAIAAGAFDLLCVDDRGFENNIQEEVSRLALHFGRLQQYREYMRNRDRYDRFLRKSKSNESRITLKSHILRSVIPDEIYKIRVTQAVKQHYLSLLRGEVERFKTLKELPLSDLSKKEQEELRKQFIEFDAGIILYQAPHKLDRLIMFLGFVEFSRLDRLGDKSFFRDWVASFAVHMYGSNMLSEDFESKLQRLARRKLREPDSVQDVIYRVIYHYLPEDVRSSFQYYVTLKDPSTASDSLKNQLTDAIIAWSIDDVMMEQLFSFFKLQSFIRENLVKTQDKLPRLLLECNEQPRDMLRKIIYLANLKSESGEQVDLSKLIFSVIGYCPTFRNGLNEFVGDRADHVLAPLMWRISRSDIAKMDPFIRNWSVGICAKFVWQLMMDHCYDAAAYFVKRCLETNQINSPEFNAEIKLLIEHDPGKFEIRSLHQLFAALILVCGQSYQPDKQLVHMLWQMDLMYAWRLATYDARIQVVMLTHLDENACQELLTGAEEMENVFHAQDVLSVSELTDATQVVAKIRSFLSLAMAVQALLANKTEPAKECLDAANMYAPEFFLTQMQLLLDNPRLSGLETPQKLFIYDYMQHLIDSVTNKPDNSVLYECLIESVRGKIPQTSHENMVVAEPITSKKI